MTQLAEVTELPSARVFPVDSLPGTYEHFAKAVAKGTLTDDSVAGAAVLGGVSAIVGTRVRLRVTESWCYHSGLYLVLLAPSSYGKSSVIEAVDEPIRTLEAELRSETADRVRRSRAEVIHVEGQIKAKTAHLASALKNGKSGGDLATEIAELEDDLRALREGATPPVLVADDFTVEAVVDVLEQNGERVCVTSGDTGVFNVERYSDNPSIELLLKAWKGEPHREIRRGRAEDADLRQPSMSMLVATQVENVKALALKNPGLVHRGLLPRFLPVVPEDNIGFRDVKSAILNGQGIPRHLQADFNDRLVTLANVLAAAEGGVVELHLDEDAREAVIEAYQGYEFRMGPEGDLRPILEAAGKLPLQLAKLIGINWAMTATLGNDAGVSVGVELVRAAIRQLEYFIGQQHRLYDALHEAPAEALAGKLRQWCDYHPGETITAYKLRKSTARHSPRSLFDEALTILEDEGIVWVERVNTGGRPSRKVHVL